MWRVRGASGCHGCRRRCRSSIWILQVSDDVAILVLVTLLFLLNLKLVHFLNVCFWWCLWWYWRLDLSLDEVEVLLAPVALLDEVKVDPVVVVFLLVPLENTDHQDVVSRASEHHLGEFLDGEFGGVPLRKLQHPVLEFEVVAHLISGTLAVESLLLKLLLFFWNETATISEAFVKIVQDLAVRSLQEGLLWWRVCLASRSSAVTWWRRHRGQGRPCATCTRGTRRDWTRPPSYTLPSPSQLVFEHQQLCPRL